ncbi:hypothetical protein PR003_g10177 [Phytophthora rubi]|uniref:Uncharacterized protein n=1 Tax=Phytophthora rubi TaxID=129364 RepID=A0A6A4FQ40_9STRA|nr:hypothetical protein PR001_g9795 [Phytophthora rubi]KAE9341042.1 hypothetical protein PR003_g10177 [Phytophthora rubi]
MALYDLMEFSLCGTVGVVALVAALNALNYLLKWTSFGPETTVAIGCMGFLTHGWRLGDGGGRLRKMAPRFVVGSAWDSVLQHADDRDRSESASLLRLQEPDVEELEDFQAALDDPCPDEWTPRFHRSHDFTRADVELANTLTDLAAQASAITKMAAQAQLRVRRGRQPSGRGDWPVPGNVGGIPGGSSLDLAGTTPPPRPPGVNPSRRVGTAADGYITSTARPVPSATSRMTAPTRDSGCRRPRRRRESVPFQHCGVGDGGQADEVVLCGDSGEEESCSRKDGTSRCRGECARGSVVLMSAPAAADALSFLSVVHFPAENQVN